MSRSDVIAVRHLAAQPASKAAIKPFGALISRAADSAVGSSDFYKGWVRMSRPVDFTCDHPVDIQLATLVQRAMEVRYLERHFQHTQTFIPLGGKPFVMVLAPPSEGSLPDLSAARAFRFEGGQGMTLHRGVWHEFPFALEDDTDLVVILSSQTGYDLANKDPLTFEASGPDLDKKDIVARLGARLVVDVEVRATD